MGLLQAWQRTPQNPVEEDKTATCTLKVAHLVTGSSRPQY